MKEEQVILVDAEDCHIGQMDKMEAHQKGLLHRAFSVFVFNSNGEMLIHQRAAEKYHSPGLWTNACCSHPRIDETNEEAVHRRLVEEMGFDCPVHKVFQFTYRAELENGLVEHEFDHVYFGSFNGSPLPNPEEVQNWKFVSMDELHQSISNHPEHYTPWFKIAMRKIDEEQLTPSA